jgi:hypothetical protein
MPRGTTTAVGASCTNCGSVAAFYEADGTLRCEECGRYCSEDDDYCLKHDCHVDTLTGLTRCPHCVEERLIEAQT